jgi:hypothetical protein
MRLNQLGTPAGLKRLLKCFMGVGVLAAATAHASTQFFDFNSDPTTSGLLTLYGNGVWQSTDGAGAATNANDGYLQVTAAVGSQRTVIVFADFDNGAVISGFTFDADLRIGNGTSSPADGFSINYVRADDPVLSVVANEGDPSSAGSDPNPPAGAQWIGHGVFATGPDGEDNLPEEGTWTGVSIGFDAWDSGGSATGPWPFEVGGVNGCGPTSTGSDIIGIDVRVDGWLVQQIPMPTLNGAVTDATSLQTGPNDTTGNPDVLGWAHLTVSVDTNGVLNVTWKGVKVVSNYQTTYFPSPGALVFAGRTGGANENHDIDNIKIVTIPSAGAVFGPATGFPDGVTITVTDSGPSVVDPTKPAGFVLNGVAVTPTVSKTGTTTTLAYHGWPAILTPGATNTLVASVQDTHGNPLSATRTFVTPAFTPLNSAWAVTSGVNLTQPGFRMLPWQSGNEPNTVLYMEQQLEGLDGTNNANLSSATDGGFIDWTSVINFNINVGNGDNGNFQTANGYPDVFFPGIPGANGLTGSSAELILTYLQFASPGLYTMGVNSDDGFVVTAGSNPRDILSPVLGQFNGGRGSSDTTFQIAVTNAGVYPFCLRWENGNGELPGNGANLEWFTVANGVKYLINDPSPTNTSGVAAYYAGPAPRAYVSNLNPYNGQTACYPDRVLAQITSQATSVSGAPVLLIDGVDSHAATTTAGNITTVLATLAAPGMSAGTHTATLVWSDTAGHNYSEPWSFTVGAFPTLWAALSSPVNSVDTTKPGFVLKVTQLDPSVVGDNGDSTANNAEENNGLLEGLYFPDYGTNTADTVNGGGSGIPAVFGNVWYWTNAVDFNVVTSPGDFTYDYALPGIPGVTGNANFYAAGFQTYLVFPTAGFYRMGVNSDDGFRLTEGLGMTRQALHVTGAGINQDMEAVVASTNNSDSFGGSLPVPPIVAPGVWLDAAAACPGWPSMNITGKVGIIEYNQCGHNCNQAAWCVQTNGGVAAVIVNQPGYGLPFVADGSGLPVTIPVFVVNGRSADGGTGALDFWRTNNLTVSFGDDAYLRLNQANYGKGMSEVDSGFWVPVAGAYPFRLMYFQGGGGAGCEWSTISPSGVRSLVNDVTDPNSIRAYRAVTTHPKLNAPTVSGGTVTVTWQGAGILQSSTTIRPADWSDVSPQPGNNVFTAPSSGAPTYYRVRVPVPVQP